MNKESLKRLALERNMSVEELEKYREYSSRDLTGKEWIEYLKLCEKVFKNTSKYIYIYENEIKKINEYIKQLQQENEQLKERVKYLEDNRNKLKEYMSDENISNLFERGYQANDFIEEIRDITQEIEGSDSNE